MFEKITDYIIEHDLLFIIIVLVFFGGNVCLFTGEFNDELLNANSEDSFVVWIFVIAVLVADIALVSYIIYACVRRFIQRQEEKEKQRINEVTNKVNGLIKQYFPLNASVIRKPQLSLDVDSQYINNEVLLTVGQFKEMLTSTISKCQAIDNSIKSVLSCSGCNGVDQKFGYLMRQKWKLDKLKAERDALHSDIQKHKIQLLNENEETLILAKNAFLSLLYSKKCLCEDLDVKEFVTEFAPDELDLFEYKDSPVSLFVNNLYYCLFSNIILVFDKTGVFVSAIDPSAIRVEIEKFSDKVLIRNNTLTHEYIAVDSKCLSQGHVIKTWTYTCRDGSPDLRYSYNPSIEFRNDKYEYGKISIWIGETKISFFVSSEKTIKYFEEMSLIYCQKHNNLHNPIPEFLQLLEILNEEDEQTIAYINDEFSKSSTSNNYFCSIT